MAAFIRVCKREIRQIISKPTYWFSTLILPLFVLLIMTTIFSNGLIRELPIGVVDEDNSRLSRQIARHLETVPELKVKNIYSNITQAQNDVVKKKIYGFVYIPHNFDKNIKANKEVEIPFYYHYAFLSVGGEVLSGFYSYLTTLATLPLYNIATTLDIDKEKVEAIAFPITADFHPLNNPSLDYTIYLSYTYFYVVFQILILLTIAYSIGMERKDNTVSTWISAGGFDRYACMYGKLLPYFVIYSIISCFANMILFNVVKIPLASNLLDISSTSILLVAATISLSVFIFSINPNLPLIISFISMFGSLGASLVGITFPVTSMPKIMEWASWLFPLRHFAIISQNLCDEDLSLFYTWKNYVALLLFLLLPFVTMARILPKKYFSRQQ